MTREQRPAPHRHAHGDLTSLTPEESLPELPVVPLRKPHSGTAARENPRYAPVISEIPAGSTHIKKSGVILEQLEM